jgi:hypothetical protein
MAPSLRLVKPRHDRLDAGPRSLCRTPRQSGSGPPSITPSFPNLTTMTAQVLRSHLSEPHRLRYTLVFRNGELLRHQDPLSLAQYRSDARVLRVEEESPRSVA